jgi:hypothetical protein
VKELGEELTSSTTVTSLVVRRSTPLEHIMGPHERSPNIRTVSLSTILISSMYFSG